MISNVAMKEKYLWAFYMHFADVFVRFGGDISDLSILLVIAVCRIQYQTREA